MCHLFGSSYVNVITVSVTGLMLPDKQGSHYTSIPLTMVNHGYTASHISVLISKPLLMV